MYNFVPKCSDKVEDIKEEDIFVKSARVCSNIEIANDNSFHYFMEVSSIILPN